MKKTVKKSLALLLSALMVISMLHAFAITAFADEWIAVASSDLTSSEVVWNNNCNWDWSMDMYTNKVPNTSAGGNKLSWRANQFTISVGNLAEQDYIYRGYVIYDDGTSLKTVYTDVNYKN